MILAVFDILHRSKFKMGIIRSFLVKYNSFLLSFERPLIISSSDMVYTLRHGCRRITAAARDFHHFYTSFIVRYDRILRHVISVIRLLIL